MVAFKDQNLFRALTLLIVIFFHLPMTAQTVSQTAFQTAAPIDAPDLTDQILNQWGNDPEWKAILHYQKRTLQRERSVIDGEGFFFSPQGKVDPVAELKASAAAMYNSELKVGAFKLHPQCAFPYRYWFLKNRFRITAEPVVCERLEDFLSQFNEPQSISVVFSSAYPNNPASMFGHTFLKINSKNQADIRDMGINYAARVPPDEHPLAFIYFGIFGGYPGQWSTTSYHSKIKEYVQGENRDLWEYELNLTPSETRLFLMHLWELETNSYSDYFFFDENCSYKILAALKVFRPHLNLTKYRMCLFEDAFDLRLQGRDRS